MIQATAQSISEWGKGSCQTPQIHFLKHWSYYRDRKRYVSKELDSGTMTFFGLSMYRPSLQQVLNQLSYPWFPRPAELLPNWVLGGVVEKGKNLHFWERGKFVLAELNMSFWLPPELFCLKRGWIPRNPSHSTILAHWWSSVCHRGSFIAIATCLFWCRPSNLWAYWFRPADVQFTYSLFSPFVGLKNTSFKK